MAVLTRQAETVRTTLSWTLVVDEVTPSRTYRLVVDESARSVDPDGVTRWRWSVQELVDTQWRSVATGSTVREPATMLNAQAWRLLEPVIEAQLGATDLVLA